MERLQGPGQEVDLVQLKPIGTVRHAAQEVPRHWSCSEVEGRLLINKPYRPGLRHIKRGQAIVVLFRFHKSPRFSKDKLFQTPPRRRKPRGVFSTCSPVRPNPIGLSVLKVLGVRGGEVRVRGLDMLDGTPILDIKPHFELG